MNEIQDKSQRAKKFTIQFDPEEPTYNLLISVQDDMNLISLAEVARLLIKKGYDQLQSEKNLVLNTS